MLIAGEDFSSPTGTILSPTSVPNWKKMPGSDGSVRQLTEADSKSIHDNVTAVAMFCAWMSLSWAMLASSHEQLRRAYIVKPFALQFCAYKVLTTISSTYTACLHIILAYRKRPWRCERRVLLIMVRRFNVWYMSAKSMNLCGLHNDAGCSSNLRLKKLLA